MIATKATATKATATKTVSACIAVVAATVVVVVIARIDLTMVVAISKARPRNRPNKTKAVVTSHVSLSKPTTAGCSRASENFNRLQN